MKCPNCNHDTLQEIKGDYIEGKYTIKNAQWLKCSYCNEEIFDPPMLEEIEKAYYFNMNILTPEIIKSTRKLYKKTQETLADEISVKPITIKRWESGEFIPPSDKCDLLRATFEKWEKEKLKNLQLEKWFKQIRKPTYPELCAVATHSTNNTSPDSEELNELLKTLEK